MPLSTIARIIADLQWRGRKPARREAESHQAYIERRLVEMDHAINARQAWALFEQAGDGMNWLRHLNKLNDRARGLYRIDLRQQPWGDFYLPSSPQGPFGYERVKEHNLRVVERRFNANQWDFAEHEPPKKVM
jgi:hypothetical protein